MLREIAVERYGFRCRRCQYIWSADYDVTYASDADGSLWAFYRRDGYPVENPTADIVLCPDCGRGAVAVELLGRRDVPLPDVEHTRPRQKITSTAAQRRAAPPLPSRQASSLGDTHAV